MSETLNTGSEETAENIGDNGPWGEEYQNSVPPFRSEIPNNPDEIDISTEQGKYEWLDALLENAVTREEAELEDAKNDGYEEGDKIVDDLNAKLEFDKRQQKILMEKIDVDGEGGVVGALQKEYVASQKRLSEMQQNGAAQNAIDTAYKQYQASQNLLNLIESEITRRAEVNQ